MGVFRFVIELELSSSIYKLGDIQLNDWSWNDNGLVLDIFYKPYSKWIENNEDQNTNTEMEISELFNFVQGGNRMIQIKKVKSDEAQIDEIVCPYFIMNHRKFKYDVVPGTNRVKFVNQGKDIIEFEPGTEYIFTLKKRSKFSLNFLWFFMLFLLI